MRAKLLALAAAHPGEEVCGLLFGDDAAITAIGPCANVAANPEDSFEIDPAALIAAHRATRGGGPRMIGWYHSHPNGVCAPSARDVAMADEDGKLWLIIGAGQIALWRAEQGGFIAIPLCGI